MFNIIMADWHVGRMKDEISEFYKSIGFPKYKFHKWAQYSGKFILGCYIKFDCGSLGL